MMMENLFTTIFKWGIKIGGILGVAVLAFWLIQALFIGGLLITEVEIEATKLINVNNIFDVICNWCIQVLWHMSDCFGASYGLLNVLLFIILEPAAICFFALSSFIFKGERTPTKQRWGKIMLILGIITIFAIVLPIMWTLIDGTFLYPH